MTISIEEHNKLMEEQERRIVDSLYTMTVQFAFSSHITTKMLRMYPDALFKPRSDHDLF